MTSKYILGIWDGHDSGAALISDNKIICAINEERLTKRKSEIKFPYNSIKEIIKQTKISLNEIKNITFTTTDFSKTLGRVFPKSKEEYYLIRRKKKKISNFQLFKKKIKYHITTGKPNKIFENISRIIIKQELNKIGIKNAKIHCFNHHFCHAISASSLSNFQESLIITLDGVGDGLSGTIYTLKNNKLNLKKSISAKDSFGIFYEHSTNILNMRELEDEGKVMALSDYAYPTDITQNPLINFFKITGLNVKSKYNPVRMYDEIQIIYRMHSSEEFAYFCQQALEYWIIKFVKNTLKKYPFENICLAGGVFSNIKLNMKIKGLNEIKNCYIFPNMGDGGLALGSAMALNYNSNKIIHYENKNLFLGLEYDNNYIKKILDENKLNYQYIINPEKMAAELIYNNEIVLWFQGKMEYGPRALGNRSIIARPDSLDIKNKLNIFQKKRNWYQPFCPSILKEDAKKLLIDFNDDGINKNMTMGYHINEKYKKQLEGVISVDNTCRPQFVEKNDGIYYKLIKEFKDKSGIGVILNTSLNLHGYPLACSPEDVILILKKSKIKYSIMGNYLIINKFDNENKLIKLY